MDLPRALRDFSFATRSTVSTDSARILAETATRLFSLGSLLATRSDYGGGSSVPNAWREMIQEAWDELSDLWDEFDGETRGELDPLHEDEGDEAEGNRPLLRVWRVVTDFVDDVFGDDGEETTASPDNSRGHTTRQESESSDLEANNPEPAQTTGDASQINQAAERAPTPNEQASTPGIEPNGATASGAGTDRLADPGSDFSSQPNNSSAEAGADHGNQPHASAA
jgi:hypothetical protein